MNAWKPSRRSLTKALGLGAAATFLPLLRPRPSRAANEAPTRLLVFWLGHGVPRHVYDFKSAGGGAASKTDFVFPAVREPLNAVKKDLIALSGIGMRSAEADGSQAANAHYAGETHSLAATNRANPDTAGGPSIDQYIAKAINSPSPVTKFQSLSLALQVDGNVSATKVCTQASGQVVSLDVNPASVYKRLFASFTPPSMTPAPMPGPSPAEVALEQDKSVLDFVLNDFDVVKPKLSREQQQKLDAHESAVRDLEKSLALGDQGGTASGAACADPTSTVTAGTGNAYPGTETMHQANITSMSKLVTAAFACDLTRVSLLCVSDPFDAAFDYQSGSWGTTDAHDLIHKTSFNGAGSLKDNPDAMAAVTRWHQWEAKQYVSMLDSLRQIPEGQGTLLDHTIVLLCGQIGEHGHDVDQLPWVIGGGAAVGFQGGRLLQFDKAAHNDLFVSIAQAMGVQTSTFGNPSVCKGPLDGLRV
ncbi:MAG TPA: DUF1552 domain-containing protein [Polyangiaceae bacterium]|nr:DUF1552 domain-containing protein [Polyangiaceae bacterium]